MPVKVNSVSKKNLYPAIPLGDQKKSVRALAELGEILIGARGDGLDKAVTYRELVDVGLLGYKKLTRNGGVDSVVVIGDTDNTIQVPNKPTGFSASGGWSAILLSWDSPAYHGHAYAEIYRSESNNLGTAVKVGDTRANLFSDVIGTGEGYYYWVRFVNQNDVSGPFNATSGTFGKTAPDVGFLIDTLSGSINSSMLANELRARINLIDQPEAGLIYKFEKLEDAYYEPDGITPKYEAAIVEYDSLLTGPNGAIATAIDQISVTVNGQAISLQELAQVSVGDDGQYFAQWGVKSTVADVLSGVERTGGIGLYNDGLRIQFLVVADQFSIISPLDNSASALFTVSYGDTKINGVTVPAGVYIDNAMINTAYIQSLVAEYINADYINAVIQLTALHIKGGTIEIGATNNDPNELSGFRVDENGFMRTTGAVMKNITILDNNNNVVFASGTGGTSNPGTINVSQILGLGNLATRDTINATHFPGLETEISNKVTTFINAAYIQTLFSSTIFAGRIYAHNIEGDVVDARTITLNNTIHVNNTTKTVLTFQLDKNPFFERQLFINNLVIDHNNGSSSTSRAVIILKLDGVIVHQSEQVDNTESAQLAADISQAIPIDDTVGRHVVEVVVSTSATSTGGGNEVQINPLTLLIQVFKQGSTIHPVSWG